MYITDTTDNVLELFEKLDLYDNIKKMRFLLYVFDLLNNKQINNKNEVNPDLIEDEDLIIFNFETLGYPTDFGRAFVGYNIMVYHHLSNTNSIYEDNGSVIGLEFSNEEIELIGIFQKLNYNEKLDVFRELIIKYDNETYFNDKITMLNFDSKASGFDIADRIRDLKI